MIRAWIIIVKVTNILKYNIFAICINYNKKNIGYASMGAYPIIFYSYILMFIYITDSLFIYATASFIFLTTTAWTGVISSNFLTLNNCS